MRPVYTQIFIIFVKLLVYIMKYSQLHRFYLIDGMLYLNAEGMSSGEMLESINSALKEKGLPCITLRQLQKDISDMKEILGAPISSGRGQRRIKYDDFSFCIFNRTRDPYKLSGSQDVLSGRLNWLRLQVNHMQECFNNDKMLEIVDYDDNLKLANIEGLPKIMYAISKERMIKFRYAKDFSKETESKCVHPYFLHQYNNRWYLFALYRGKDNPRPGVKTDSTRDVIRYYAVDRMSEIEECSGRSYDYQRLNVPELKAYKQKYFSHIVGLHNDRREPVDLELQFDYSSGEKAGDNENRLFYNLLKSNPFYDGFSFRDDDCSGTASANIRRNPELENHLMMYAHTAYISDDSIRKGVVERARKILERQSKRG